MRSLALLLVLVASPVGAMTEQELQRCVWSCLANFGPNTNPAYHSCVKDKCVPESGSQDRATSPDNPSSTAALTQWSAGTTFDGAAQFAGLGDADGTYGFYYLCDRQGRSEIMLVGLQGPGAIMTIAVDGAQFRYIFEKGSGGHKTPLSPDHPLIAELSRGTSVEVINPSGISVLRYGLQGASRALAATIANCR